jgi:hypothetical protein
MGMNHRPSSAKLFAQIRVSGLVSKSRKSVGSNCRNRIRTPIDGEARCIALRGEYMFVAEGAGRLPRLARDVANIAKQVSNALSPRLFHRWAGRTCVHHQCHTCMALPTTNRIAPLRN